MNLSRSTLYYYALPAFSLAMLGLPLYIYLPTFYTQDLGLSALEVGIVLFIARSFDIAFDPLIGSLSDRFSGRKLMMFIGIIILLLGFYALSYPMKSWMWLLGFSFITYSGWSLISIPYLALSAELSKDYHDNTRLASTRELFTIVGLICALVLPYSLDIAQDAQSTIRLMLILVSISLPLLFFFFFKNIQEPLHTSKPLNFLNGLSFLWKQTPDARSLFIAFFTNSLANALPATLFLFFVSLVLNTPEQTGSFLLLYFFSGLLALPLWLHLAKSFGKKRTWISSMILASCAFIFVPFLQSDDTFYFMIITFISGISLGADMALPAAIQADISQKLEKKGQKLTGVLFGFWAMLTKLSLALAVGIAFGILGLVGFDPKLPTSNALNTLSLLYGLAPVIFKTISIFFICKYKDHL